MEIRSLYKFRKQLARFVHEKFVMQPLALKVPMFLYCAPGICCYEIALHARQISAIFSQCCSSQGAIVARSSDPGLQCDGNYSLTGFDIG